MCARTCVCGGGGGGGGGGGLMQPMDTSLHKI